MPTEDDYTNTLHRMLDTSTTATKLTVFMHCVGMLVELHCPLLLCQLRICTGIYAIKYSYHLLVVYKHKIDTMAIKHIGNSHSNQYR